MSPCRGGSRCWGGGSCQGALLARGVGSPWWEVSLPGGFPCWGVLPAGGLPARGVLPAGGSPWQGVLPTGDPPMNRMINRCKNITLATTSLRPVIKQVAFQSNANHPLAASMGYIKSEGM